MDVELLLFEGAGENAVGEVLHPGEQRQVEVVTTVTAQHVHTQQDLALRDLLTGRLALKTKQRPFKCLSTLIYSSDSPLNNSRV